MTKNLNEDEADIAIRLLTEYTTKIIEMQKDIQEVIAVPNRSRVLKAILHMHSTSFHAIEEDLEALTRYGSHIYEHFSLIDGTKLELRMKLDEFEAQLGEVKSLFVKFGAHTAPL